MACEELKKEANKTIIEEKARIIYEDYISILSPKEVGTPQRASSREAVGKTKGTVRLPQNRDGDPTCTRSTQMPLTVVPHAGSQWARKSVKAFGPLSGESISDFHQILQKGESMHFIVNTLKTSCPVSVSLNKIILLFWTPVIFRAIFIWIEITLVMCHRGFPCGVLPLEKRDCQRGISQASFPQFLFLQI